MELKQKEMFTICSGSAVRRWASRPLRWRPTQWWVISTLKLKKLFWSRREWKGAGWFVLRSSSSIIMTFLLILSKHDFKLSSLLPFSKNLSTEKTHTERKRVKPRQCFWKRCARNSPFSCVSVPSSTLTSDSRVEQLFVVSFVCPHFGLYQVEWGIWTDVRRSSIIITVN